MFTGFICLMVWGLNSPSMGVPAPNQHLHVFAVNLLSPVRASTRPLPQPARQNSKKTWRPSRLRGEKYPLCALPVFAVKIFQPKLPPSHQHPPIFTQKIPKKFPN
jgi:hypothetical protein